MLSDGSGAYKAGTLAPVKEISESEITIVKLTALGSFRLNLPCWNRADDINQRYKSDSDWRNKNATKMRSNFDVRRENLDTYKSIP